MTTTRTLKGYEEGFDYGHTCALRMSRERRSDNAQYVRASEYFAPHSPTREYWRGFVDAMESSLF